MRIDPSVIEQAKKAKEKAEAENAPKPEPVMVGYDDMRKTIANDVFKKLTNNMANRFADNVIANEIKFLEVLGTSAYK